jgi:hypothetical protein
VAVCIDSDDGRARGQIRHVSLDSGDEPASQIVYIDWDVSQFMEIDVS